MKNVTLFAIVLSALSTGSVWAQESVNLTPLPKEIQVGQGTLTLPQKFSINMNGLADSVKVEAQKFVEDYTKVSGAEVTISDQGDASSLISLKMNTGANNMGPEAYKLKITEKDITIEAETTRGFFYAFQSLKKLMPPCVMAGVKDPKVTTFILPVVDINDAPRFEYRGYMLDVCRHFFTVDEIKRILRVMSYYKMNKFHWHLTEDQGWRVEIKKYPKLTSVGSVREFSWNTDYPGTGKRYRTYEPYGPYFYTQEEIKDVVKYAQDLHIDIIPEVDMPGHFAAAMTAYPEYSCNPEGAHSVWCDGGISSDVLNVANPQAVQFAMDIMDELINLFPYPYFHIGGDECPTTAWENNAECKALMQELGYTSARQLQSRFIHQLAEHAATKGRKLYVWNEAISASGADVNVIKEAGATIMCWTGADNAASAAAKLGLKSVMTPQPNYYLSRVQATSGEPNGPAGVTTLSDTYNYNPTGYAPSGMENYYLGVQGSMWTEHINTEQHLEYMNYPRLMAVAEAGWSPQAKRNYENFLNRMRQDTVMLNYMNMDFCRLHLKTESSSDVVLPQASTQDNMVWYRLVTMATDNVRNNQCMELLQEGSSQITQYSKNGAAAGVLWSGTQAKEGDKNYDYQWWALVEDPQHKGKYALVCKAFPNGSVNPTASKSDNTGRWSYDKETMHYGFTIETGSYYGKTGDNYYYALKSDQYSNNYVNMGAGGQGYAVNLYGDPKDGNGGLWEFQPLNPVVVSNTADLINQANTLMSQATYYETGKPEIGKYDAAQEAALKAVIAKENVTAEEIEAAIKAFEASLGVPQDGNQIRIVNSVEGSYKGLSIADEDGQLRTSDTTFCSDIWVVENSADGSFALKNLVSGKYINGTANPLTLGTSAVSYKYAFNPAEHDFTLSTSEGKALFPVSKDYVTDPGSIYVDGIRAQGAAWNMEKVWQVKYNCVDENGNSLGTYYQAVADGADATCTGPEIRNFKAVSYDGKETAPVVEKISANQEIKVVYKRTAYSLVFKCCDENGYFLQSDTLNCKLNEAVEIAYPEVPYYTFKEGSLPTGSYTPTKDEVITATYTTEAMYVGFKAVGDAVTQLEAGVPYLIYDASTADSGKRKGFISISSTGQVLTTQVSSGKPSFVWSLVAGAGANQYKVMGYNEKYIPSLPSGSAVNVGNNGDTFTFTLNADSKTWSIKGTNGMFWNGNAGSMTGWSDAHPYQVYTFSPVPYFEVNCSYVDENGNAVTGLSATTSLVQGGDTYTLNVPEVEGYETPKVNVTEDQLESVSANLDIQVVYKKIETGINEIEAETQKNGKLYDLNGRELKKATVKGIYIENGQKVVK